MKEIYVIGQSFLTGAWHPRKIKKTIYTMLRSHFLA